MKYVITTSHDHKGDTTTRPMAFEEAGDLFGSLAGVEITKIVEGEEIVKGNLTLRQATTIELCAIEDERLNVDEIVDSFSDDRFTLAYDRAVREFGGVVWDHDDEDFVEEFAWQLRKLAAADFIQCARQEDHQTDVDADGEIRYTFN